MATLIESNPSFTIELFRDDIAMVMKSIGNKECLRLFCNFLGINLEKCQLPKTTFLEPSIKRRKKSSVLPFHGGSSVTIIVLFSLLGIISLTKDRKLMEYLSNYKSITWMSVLFV